MSRRPAIALFALAAGALFGFGLALSTMVRPEVVIDFLLWRDLGLLLVLGGAAVVTFVAFRLVPRLFRTPWAGGEFGRHPSVLDRRTLGGAAIFGVGWGLSGVCPGPAIAGLGTGNWPLALALAGLVLGAWVQGRYFGGNP